MVKLYSEILSKEVEISDKPQRVISLSPAITETLYLIGAGDRVVGVSFFCNKPPEVSKKPRVGAYLNVNYNLLEKLNPELLLVTTGAQRERIEELESKGYKVYPIPLPVNIYGILDNIMITGIVVNEIDNARELAYKLTEKLIEIKNILKGVRIYYEIDLGGPVSVGSHSYIGDAFKFMGMSHVFENERVPYVINPDPNSIIKYNPDVIIYEQKLGENATVDKFIQNLEKRNIKEINAVKNKNIVIMEYDSLAHYGPSFFDAAIRLANRIKELKL
ncbi:MAG: ABC transporter substrate-binding protein [Caldisphaera sp.]|jgi:ABC-type Fe3+-hydroxamate transport system substrate-binding protein|uniref:ABC transporter substrate-binding protein n=1 Tax=Caldisphaera sp. TaxID=2060322 RepID=UPI000CAC37F8|nr:MAG: ABC transporter substrate-binding protein [Caldisphaera sp.]PMP89066.1 MAG: ABC transporter substrate-binding protein [Caldisphaera sp.]